jgi:hypothetical protein
MGQGQSPLVHFYFIGILAVSNNCHCYILARIRKRRREYISSIYRNDMLSNLKKIIPKIPDFYYKKYALPQQIFRKNKVITIHFLNKFTKWIVIRQTSFWIIELQRSTK